MNIVVRIIGGVLITGALFLSACDKGAQKKSNTGVMGKDEKLSFKVQKTEAEWRKILTDEQYMILRQKATEKPFTGRFNNHSEDGTYSCIGCGNELFTSDTKYDSGCGWPSFYDALDKKRVLTDTDFSHGMVRTELICGDCGGHLGHLFDDGPDPTGLRYCVNSIVLDFKAGIAKK